MVDINDIEDERIRLYRSLKATPKEHTCNNIFIAENEKVVLEVLKSKLRIHSIFALAEYHDQYRDLIDNRIEQENQLTCSRELMNKIVGFRLHKGIMCIADVPKFSSIDELETPIVALNGIVNSENVGAIVRNCIAFGVNSLIFDKETSSPYLRRAIRVSIGSVMNLKIYASENLADTLLKLKSNQTRIISSEICGDSIPFNQYERKDCNFCLIFGSEGKGIDQDILDLSDQIVNIPISDKVNSINVAASSAILLNHFT
jgi:tRNA G18 (ribose-2'-O)-methylase SpoU